MFCCRCGGELSNPEIFDDLWNWYCSEECRDESVKWRKISEKCDAVLFCISSRGEPVCIRGGKCDMEIDCPLKN